MDRDEAREKAERILQIEFDRVYQRGVQRGLTIAATQELRDHDGRRVLPARGGTEVMRRAFDLVASADEPEFSTTIVISRNWPAGVAGGSHAIVKHDSLARKILMDAGWTEADEGHGYTRMEPSDGTGERS